MSITTLFLKNFRNIPGWRTGRKLVVFESDDWGSIRMPSVKAYNKLRDAGIGVEGSHFNKYDTIESPADLNRLFEVLDAFKDRKDRSPVFTAMSIMANPDFDSIKASAFEQYSYEPFYTTALKYYGQAILPIWEKGIESNLFSPEFHGREHLNVPVWMRYLKDGVEPVRQAFEMGFTALPSSASSAITRSLQAAFDIEKKSDDLFNKQAVAEGLQIFKQVAKRDAVSFAAPNSLFSNALEEELVGKGIRVLQVSRRRKVPLGDNQYTTKYKSIGKDGKSGTIYTTRNCFFEPSASNADWVDTCLDEIQTAFRWRKPAIISTHRVNFISGLDSNNADKGLRQLHSLLNKIVKKWPDAEFVSSGELGGIIDKQAQ